MKGTMGETSSSGSEKNPYKLTENADRQNSSLAIPPDGDLLFIFFEDSSDLESNRAVDSGFPTDSRDPDRDDSDE